MFMFRRLKRAVLAAVAIVGALSFVGCPKPESSSTPTAPSGDANYKCAGCGKTEKAATNAPGPSC